MTETITGDVISTQEVPEQDDDFKRAVCNSLHFRNLKGGTYKLVRVDE